MLLFVFEFLGTTELLVILVVALVLFGPRKLPELGRSLGKSLAEFKRATDDFKRTWEREVELDKIGREIRLESEVHDGLAAASASASNLTLPLPFEERAEEATAGETTTTAVESVDEERTIARTTTQSASRVAVPVAATTTAAHAEDAPETPREQN